MCGRFNTRKRRWHHCNSGFSWIILTVLSGALLSTNWITGFSSSFTDVVNRFFLPRDAMLARYLLSSCVCPSVRPSPAGIVSKRICCTTCSYTVLHQLTRFWLIRRAVVAELLVNIVIINFFLIPPPPHSGAEYSDERVCVFCLSAITSSELHARSSSMFLCMLLWPWLGPPGVA